jgi:predicted alpha/beta superfamily hydrolase
MRTSTMAATPLLIAGAACGPADPPASPREPVPPYESFTLHSHALRETRRINVYTPPPYRPGGRAEYPVLYLLDGGVDEDFPHVAAAADQAMRARQMRPMILVGIENTERRRDMTGPTDVAADRHVAPHVGGSAAFRRFIDEELMREVRTRYRASDETAIMGESLAGLFVVETFLLEPDLFDTYVAISPSLWWDGGALARAAGTRIRDHGYGRSGRVVYLASADEDNIAPAAARMAEALRANASPQLSWRYEPRPDLTHATIYRALAPQMLRDVFSPALSIVAVTSPHAQIDPDDTTGVTPLERGTGVTREPAGAFVVMREENRGPAAALHVPDWSTRIHLSFHTPDGRVNVALTDDGAMLSASAASPGCSVLVRGLQYGYDGDERHLFGDMRTAFRELVRHCGGSLRDPAGYEGMLDAAEAGFPEAMRVMKARVSHAFGTSLERS